MFKTRWNSEVVRRFAEELAEIAEDLGLVAAPEALLDRRIFSDQTARFLIDAGLPDGCAPFVSFRDVAKGPQSLVECYGAHQFQPSDLLRLASFYVLGSDGAGNPLCVDCGRNEQVVMLDHEDRFRTQTFVASSVATLAEALLIANTVPHRDFVEHLRRCDPPAAEKSAFLPREIGMLEN